MTAHNITNLPVASSVPARLPMPAGMAQRGIAPAQWRVLVETTFPGAKTAEAVEMAIDYCRARNLDVFKKPVHIVPMWNATLRREVETIWAGINEIQITASRTNAWAGMDSPKWGPVIHRTFKGSVKQDGGWKAVTTEVHFPEWCEVTVYRLVQGKPCAFSEPVFWLEAYSTTGGRDSEMPTSMWLKRPRGQLHKVAKAAALRAAFPEEAEYTAEEMEGKVIEEGGVVIEHDAIPDHSPPPPPPPKPPLEVTIGDGWDPVKFARTKKGLREALEFMTGAVVDGQPNVVALNNALLDQVAEAIPELAGEVSELRASAAEALTPPAEDETQDSFVARFVSGAEIEQDEFPVDLSATSGSGLPSPVP
jgi:phage recombination protein Bet